MREDSPVIKTPGRDPEISVLTGVRNGQSALAYTWAGLLGQTFEDWEWVVVDDGSTDETRSWLEAQARADARIKVLSAAGSGLTQALRQGCAVARGAYLARQDVGDQSLPERLARQKGVLETSPDVAFVSCATRFLGPEGELIRVEPGTTSPGTATSELRPSSGNGGKYTGPSHHGSVMMRRAAVTAAGGYREAFYFGQDWDLWYRLVEQGRFLGMAEVLYEARLNPGGISLTRRKEQERFAALARAAAAARRAGQAEQPVLEEAAELTRVCRRRKEAPNTGLGDYFVGECLRRQGHPAARKYLSRALRVRWWDLKVWVRWGMAWKK
jgi:glycosyltransferase involved in cell wall biosynthesis